MNAHEARRQVTYLLADFGDRLNAERERKIQRRNKLCEQIKTPHPYSKAECAVMSDALLAQGGMNAYEALADKLITLVNSWED